MAALATGLWLPSKENVVLKNGLLLICGLVCAHTAWAQTTAAPAAPAASAPSASALLLAASKAAAEAETAAAVAKKAVAAADALTATANEKTTAAVAAVAGAASASGSGIKYVDKQATDNENYLGDRVDFSPVVYAKQVYLGSTTLNSIEVCIPPEARLRGLGKATLKDGSNDVEFDLFLVKEMGPPSSTCKTGSEVVKEGATVAIRPAILSKTPPNRYGWAFGTLFVPFKYQLRGDGGLSGGATLGGYVGRRWSWGGTSFQTVIFGGATKVDVAVEKPGKPAVGTTPAVEPTTVIESLAGFSYGTGVMGAIKDSFKWGLVFGADRVSKSAKYVNNGKMWVSLSLGYEFF
jgi:hypothetical protein